MKSIRMFDLVIERADISYLSLRLGLRSGVKNSTIGVKGVNNREFV